MRPVRLVCLFLLLMGMAPFVSAQSTGIGLYQFGSFDTRGFDTINLGNLNAHFEIPIVSKPGRGENFVYTLKYDSALWSNVNGTWEPNLGWGLQGLTNITGYLNYDIDLFYCQSDDPSEPPGLVLSGFVYVDPNGQSHAFNYELFECQDYDAGTYGDGSATDGSGYHIGTTMYGPTVYSPNGTVINASTTGNPYGFSYSNTTDANGNEITSNGDGTFTDTLGTTALAIGGAGTSGPLTFSYPVTLQSDGATTATATLSYGSYTVATNFQCSGIGEFGATSENLARQIVLADGSTYTFTYEPTPGVSGAVTGRIASITLPTGGTISYAYTDGCNGSGINADGTVGSLTRTTSDGSRSYVRAWINANATNTVVTDEVGNQSAHNFVIANGYFYETHGEVFQGSTSGPDLAGVFTCYNGASIPCDGNPITLPITEVKSLSRHNSGVQNMVDSFYNGSGLLTAQNQYDNGGSTLLTQQTLTYNTNNEIGTSTTLDGASNIVQLLNYGYDESPATATSGVPQHVAATGPRGNLTSTSLYVSGQWMTTSSTSYYDTGAPASTTTPSGTTQFGYDSTQTFATSTTLPTPSSGVVLSTSANYDQQSGVLTSATGMNAGQTTQYTQYDRLLRPTSISLPNGGQITNTVYSMIDHGVAQTMGNGGSSNVRTLLDAYGRTSRVAVANGQATNPWYQVDYCYDARGLLQFQSVAYQGNGWATSKQCSGSGTTYVNDALGRVTSVANSDGTSTTEYNNRSTRHTDVSGVQKITQYDALNRIASVCEVSGTQLQGEPPGSCGSDFGGTGFVTMYAYDLANHKTTITQGAQQRSFQTDEAGRTISTSEPERGTTTYSYAYNPTGLVVTRTRPQANQGNPNTTTTTTTQYDSLNRVVNVSYSDGLTPTKSFTYDTSCCWPNATSSTNLKGNLAVMGAGTSAADQTGTLFSYDIMGNVINMWQCAPSTCSSNTAMVFRFIASAYDLVGNLTMENDIAAGIIVYGRSPAGEVTSITNTNGAAGPNPANLVSNIVNGPNGPISYSLGNGLLVNSTYDPMGRSFGQWLCTNSSQPDCSGGNQVFGYSAERHGQQVANTNETLNNGAQQVISQHIVYGYDGLNRLTSTNIGSGQQTFGYAYDRYGNRWGQSAPQGGPASNFSFNSANNQITSMSYDAAGNMISDAPPPYGHNYTYDAEGNILKVDGGSTAVYVYDAMNRRVVAQTSGTAMEYSYDSTGLRTSSWFPSTNSALNAQIYWGRMPIAYRSNSNQTFFEHANWQGTQRLRTGYQGNVAETSYSYPFGDGYSENVVLSSSDQDNAHYATLDHDSETNTDHAQFRQYSSTQGRWMSPDPYNGSYRMGNPQSFNRYSYVMNRPLSAVDPSGMDQCAWDDGTMDDPAEDGGDLQSTCSSDGGIWVPSSPGITRNADGTLTDTNGYSDGVSATTAIADYLNYGLASGVAANGGVAPNNPVILQNPCSVQGRALPPSAYVMQGKQSGASAIDFSLDAAMGWPKNHYLDAQPLASGNVFQKQAYGNYVFGAYMAAAGVSKGRFVRSERASFSIRSLLYIHPEWLPDGRELSAPTGGKCREHHKRIQRSCERCRMPQLKKKHEWNEAQVSCIRRFSSIPRKHFVFLIFAICCLMSGCTGGREIWSAQSLSTDGKVLAKASVTATDGGLSVLASTDTKVVLKWASGSRKEISVLELADASDTPVDTHVDMNWLTPTHLELTYKGNQTVVFQAVKWVDIYITVRNLSSSTTSAIQ